MAGNMFMNIEGPEVKGESTDSEHTDQLQVLSWSHAFNQPTSPTRSAAGGGTVEQANHTDFQFTKYTDAATDDLLKFCWQGNMIDKCTFQAYRADGDNKPVKYLEVVMEHVIVSNISVGGGTGDIPVESVSLSYSKVTYNYIPQKKDDNTADGVQPVSHDLKLQEVA